MKRVKKKIKIKKTFQKNKEKNLSKNRDKNKKNLSQKRKIYKRVKIEENNGKEDVNLEKDLLNKVRIIILKMNSLDQFLKSIMEKLIKKKKVVHQYPITVPAFNV